MPDDVNYYNLFVLDFSKLRRIKKVSIWRNLYGYKQKVGKKVYHKKGLLKELGGRRLEKSVLLVPVDNKNKILDFFKKSKIDYKIYEVWME